MSIQSLGYLRVRSSKLDEWETFARDVLGFMPAYGPDADAQYYRLDKYPYRFVVVPGDDAGLEAVGYEVGDDRDLAAVAARLEAAGVAVKLGDAEAAKERLVSGYLAFEDPAGVPVEIFYGPILDHVPVVTPKVSGFVTGDMGMGHVVVNVPEIDPAVDFYRDVLGFHSRNTWNFNAMSMAFLGCNPRHHTLAFGAGLPIPGQLIHFMVEAATIDDVGYAQDRCLDAGVTVSSSIGKHTNDHMISFYCVSPDGYMVEFGWGGLQLGEPEQLTTYQITKPSFWGHRPLKP
ncbi:MAG TPA: VOC family protein [Ilumatobacter sp.]|nr:VOC family protein [Ilumatobacter sp.]